jgi:monofunctional biosynthetic peptidoglycan transglycosylase
MDVVHWLHPAFIYTSSDPRMDRQSTPESTQPVETPAAPSRTRRLATRVGKVVAAIALGYYAFCLLLLLVYRFAAPPLTGVQLQRRVEASVKGRQYRVQKTFVPYRQLPRHVSSAVIAAEDGRFWRHWGFDLEEMAAAGLSVFDGEIPRGASTITQQLMKNLFGGTARNPVRKLYDVTLTPPAELILGKQRILELYLNNVEWGPGVFGIEAAAKYHYGTRAKDLSRNQAAGLAALLPNPLRRTPANTPQYRSEILRRMAHRGW